MVDLPITKWIKKKIRRLIAIVEDTDVATHSIASGKYVVWKGDLCKTTAAIAVGGTLSLSNLSPVSNGGLNELSEQIVTVNNNLVSNVPITATPASGVTIARFSKSNKCGRYAYIEFVLDLTSNKAIYDQLFTMSVKSFGVTYSPLFNGATYANMNVGFTVNGNIVGTMGSIASGTRVCGSAIFLVDEQ